MIDNNLFLSNTSPFQYFTFNFPIISIPYPFNNLILSTFCNILIHINSFQFISQFINFQYFFLYFTIFYQISLFQQFRIILIYQKLFTQLIRFQPKITSNSHTIHSNYHSKSHQNTQHIKTINKPIYTQYILTYFVINCIFAHYKLQYSQFTPNNSQNIQYSIHKQ